MSVSKTQQEFGKEDSDVIKALVKTYLLDIDKLKERIADLQQKITELEEASTT